MATSAETRRRLDVFLFVVAAALSFMAIYDLAQGERATSVWIAVVCWPIVAVATCWRLFGPQRA